MGHQPYDPQRRGPEDGERILFAVVRLQLDTVAAHAVIVEAEMDRQESAGMSTAPQLRDPPCRFGISHQLFDVQRKNVLDLFQRTGAYPDQPTLEAHFTSDP